MSKPQFDLSEKEISLLASVPDDGEHFQLRVWLAECVLRAEAGAGSRLKYHQSWSLLIRFRT
eukprot:3687832-Pleurochrysis_carterae.AAC.1